MQLMQETLDSSPLLIAAIIIAAIYNLSWLVCFFNGDWPKKGKK